MSARRWRHVAVWTGAGGVSLGVHAMTPGESDRWRAEAAAVRARLHGVSGDSRLSSNAMAELAPEFAQVLGDWAMSRYADETLDLPTRALCTVAALAALGEDRYTQNWISNALSAGVTRSQVIVLLEQVSPYIGVPKAVGAFQAAKAAFDQHEG
jgi:4-carboxymuconolactone decarboxylase